MAEDKQVKKYLENIPYSDTSNVAEIHGTKNYAVIKDMVGDLVVKYDENMANGDKDKANFFNGAIKQIHQDLSNLKNIKEEFGMNYGGGTGGKNMFSNYTDLSFEKKFFIESGRISFDNNLRPILSILTDNEEYMAKQIEDITQDWVVKGTEETDFMKMQQDAQRQSNTINEPLDFDIDWHVSNLLSNMDAWKSFVSDKIGGRYFLNDYIEENSDAIASGEISDEMLHPDSFNPDFDNRLHEHYAGILKRAFNPNYQTAKEAQEADELMARNDPNSNNLI